MENMTGQPEAIIPGLLFQPDLLALKITVEGELKVDWERIKEKAEITDDEVKRQRDAMLIQDNQMFVPTGPTPDQEETMQAMIDGNHANNVAAQQQTVTSKDTLGDIAAANNMSTDDLLKLNPQLQGRENYLKDGETINFNPYNVSSDHATAQEIAKSQQIQQGMDSQNQTANGNAAQNSAGVNLTMNLLKPGQNININPFYNPYNISTQPSIVTANNLNALNNPSIISAPVGINQQQGQMNISIGQSYVTALNQSYQADKASWPQLSAYDPSMSMTEDQSGLQPSKYGYANIDGSVTGYMVTPQQAAQEDKDQKTLTALAVGSVPMLIAPMLTPIELGSDATLLNMVLNGTGNFAKNFVLGGVSTYLSKTITDPESAGIGDVVEGGGYVAIGSAIGAFNSLGGSLTFSAFYGGLEDATKQFGFGNQTADGFWNGGGWQKTAESVASYTIFAGIPGYTLGGYYGKSYGGDFAQQFPQLNYMLGLGTGSAQSVADDIWSKGE